MITQHVARFRLPWADAARHLLRAQIPFGIRAVERHVVQLQTIGLERQRRGLRGEIQRAVEQGDGVHVQRIGYLAATQADIHFFGNQGGGFSVPTEGDVFQNEVGRRRKAVIHLVETEFVVGIYRYPAADLSRTPAGLEQNIERQHHNEQGY